MALLETLSPATVYATKGNVHLDLQAQLNLGFGAAGGAAALATAAQARITDAQSIGASGLFSGETLPSVTFTADGHLIVP